MVEEWEGKVFEKLPAVSIEDGKSTELEFLDDGSVKETKEGQRILFSVLEAGQKKNFWVNLKAGHAGDLKVLKDQHGGTLKELKIKITRTGMKKATRYKIEAIP